MLVQKERIEKKNNTKVISELENKRQFDKKKFIVKEKKN